MDKATVPVGQRAKNVIRNPVNLKTVNHLKIVNEEL